MARQLILSCTWRQHAMALELVRRGRARLSRRHGPPLLPKVNQCLINQSFTKLTVVQRRPRSSRDVNRMAMIEPPTQTICCLLQNFDTAPRWFGKCFIGRGDLARTGGNGTWELAAGQLRPGCRAADLIREGVLSHMNLLLSLHSTPAVARHVTFCTTPPPVYLELCQLR